MYIKKQKQQTARIDTLTNPAYKQHSVHKLCEINLFMFFCMYVRIYY